MLYLTVQVGPNADSVRPLFATSDTEVIGAAVRALLARAGGAALLEKYSRSSDSPRRPNPSSVLPSWEDDDEPQAA